jgi:predicted enzyme related to lactoylglutathione lyase
LSIDVAWVAETDSPTISADRVADRAAQLASDLKGRVVAGPTEVPEVGRFAMLADASDAVFGVFQASDRS